MNRLAAALLCLSWCALPAPAAPEAPPVPAHTSHGLVDLGEGLGYVRVHSFQQDGEALRAALQRNTPLVIDWRYTADTSADPEVWHQLFAARSPNVYLAALTTSSTPQALTRIFSSAQPKMIVFVLNGWTTTPPLAVAVAQPADADRHAYDAFDGGTPLATLISGKIDKERFDEAELVKEFQNGNPNATPPPTPDPAQAAPEKTPALTDRVLQRAVHLHRALAALKPRT